MSFHLKGPVTIFMDGVTLQGEPAHPEIDYEQISASILAARFAAPDDPRVALTAAGCVILDWAKGLMGLNYTMDEFTHLCRRYLPRFTERLNADFPDLAGRGTLLRLEVKPTDAGSAEINMLITDKGVGL